MKKLTNNESNLYKISWDQADRGWNTTGQWALTTIDVGFFTVAG